MIQLFVILDWLVIMSSEENEVVAAPTHTGEDGEQSKTDRIEENQETNNEPPGEDCTEDLIRGSQGGGEDIDSVSSVSVAIITGQDGDGAQSEYTHNATDNISEVEENNNMDTTNYNENGDDLDSDGNRNNTSGIDTVDNKSDENEEEDVTKDVMLSDNTMPPLIDQGFMNQAPPSAGSERCSPLPEVVPSPQEYHKSTSKLKHDITIPKTVLPELSPRKAELGRIPSPSMAEKREKERAIKSRQASRQKYPSQMYKLATVTMTSRSDISCC